MNFFSYIFATAVLSILSHQTISEENVTQTAVLNRTIEPAHNGTQISVLFFILALNLVTLPPLAVVKREVDQPDPAADDIDQPEPADDDDMSETVAKRDVEQLGTVSTFASEEHRVVAPQESSNQTGPQANGGVYTQPIFHGK
uniref:Secreted protein n=1 Tax=Globodera pallida TaxID=36090 RepID=A0A183CKD2_GLOPA